MTATPSAGKPGARTSAPLVLLLLLLAWLLPASAPAANQPTVQAYWMIQSPLGIRIIRRGTLSSEKAKSLVDEEFQKVAGGLAGKIPQILLEAAPMILHISIEFGIMETQACLRRNKYAVIQNEGLLGYTVVVDAGLLESEEQFRAVLRKAFGEYFVMLGRPWLTGIAESSESCLD